MNIIHSWQSYSDLDQNCLDGCTESTNTDIHFLGDSFYQNPPFLMDDLLDICFTLTHRSILNIWCRIKDEGGEWILSCLKGFADWQTDRWTNEWTDICDCRVVFATENWIYIDRLLQVYSFDIWDSHMQNITLNCDYSAILACLTCFSSMHF